MKKTITKDTKTKEFVSASIMMGAVNETTALKETVFGIANIVDKKDIAEILIAYPEKRVSKECLEVLNELKNTGLGIKLDIFPQKTPGIGFYSDATERATGSHCIPFQSDMGMKLEIIPELIAEAKKGGDKIVTTSRWIEKSSFKGYNKLKFILNFASQLFLKVLYGGGLTDYTNPVQIIPTEIFRKINWEETDFSRFMEMQLKPLRLGYKYREIPTDCVERTDGETSNSFGELFNYLRTAIKIRFMKKDDILKK